MRTHDALRRFTDEREQARVAPSTPAPLAPAALAGVDAHTRARVLGALQRTAGNRAVAAMLMRAPVTEPTATAESTPGAEPAVSAAVGDSPEWSATVTPTNSAERTSDLGEGTKVYRGDTLTVRARFTGLQEFEQEYIQASMEGNGLVGRDGWATADTYLWTIPVMTVGSYGLNFETRAQGETTGSHAIDLKSVTDATDLENLLGAVATAVTGKFAAALGAVGAASTAWTEAHTRQQTVLDDEKEAKRLAEEMAMGILLATVAGFGGGALAGFMKNTAMIKALGEKATIPDMQSTAIIDAAKDFLKYAVRTLPKLGGAAGATPDVAGDSTAAPQMPGTAGGGPADAAQGDSPAVFLGKLLKQLGYESAALLGEIERLQFAAADAIVVGSTEEFDEDPRAFIEGDTTLDLLAQGLPSNMEPYLEQLWGAWLSNYAYVIVPLQTVQPAFPGDQPPQSVEPPRVGNNVGSSLRTAIAADAERCGTTLDAWMATYAAPLKDRLDEELRMGEEGQCPP